MYVPIVNILPVVLASCFSAMLSESSSTEKEAVSSSTESHSDQKAMMSPDPAGGLDCYCVPRHSSASYQPTHLPLKGTYVVGSHPHINDGEYKKDQLFVEKYNFRNYFQRTPFTSNFRNFPHSIEHYHFRDHYQQQPFIKASGENGDQQNGEDAPPRSYGVPQSGSEKHETPENIEKDESNAYNNTNIPHNATKGEDKTSNMHEKYPEKFDERQNHKQLRFERPQNEYFYSEYPDHTASSPFLKFLEKINGNYRNKTKSVEQ